MNKELIYYVLNGDVEAEESGLPEELGDVTNAFAEGSECAALYEQVYEAKKRLNARLGTQEDPDIEQIISNLTRITKLISFQMYEYGKRAGAQ